MPDILAAIVERLPWEQPANVCRLGRFLGLQAQLPRTTEAHARLVHDVVVALTPLVPRDGRVHYVGSLQP